MTGDNQLPTNSANQARPTPVFVTALLLGLLFDVLIFGNVPGIGFSLFIPSIVVGAFVLCRLFHVAPSRAAWWFAVLAILFSVMVSIRSSYELTFMNAVLSLLLLLLAVSEMVGRQIRRFTIEKYVTLGWLPLYFLGNIGLFFSAWFRARQGGTSGRTTAVTRGILIALPVIALFTVLFSSADLVFQKYVQSIVHINISPETFVRIILVLLVTLLSVGAFWYSFTRRMKDEEPTTASVRSSGIGRTETLILLGSVNALFLLFIVVQLAYLFGGQQHVTGKGFTYAEYARKGFFELIVVAAISWLVVWLINKASDRDYEQEQTPARFLSMALMIQVFVIMVSAFMRLVLYEQAYGFTTLRFYSHVFIVWLAVAFVLLLYKVFVHRQEHRLAFSMLVSMLVFAGAVNLFNPDAFIAKQNIARYGTNGHIDIFYLDQLSPDAVPAMLPILEDKNVVIVNTAAGRFFWKLERLEGTSARWQSFNVGRRQALEFLRSKRKLLEKNKEFAPSLDFLKSQSTVVD